MIQEHTTERPITYHTVTLGPLTREGHAQAIITGIDEETGAPLSTTLQVPAGLPGERVTIAVEAPPAPPPKRRRRWKPRPPRAWITSLHEPSPQRVSAPCSVFGTCGGCQLQHLAYPAQLTWKYEVVRQLLQEIGHFDDQLPLLPTVPCDEPWHYRNHMRFSVNREGQPGLTARGTRYVLPLTTCPIAHRQINRVLHVLSQHPNPRPQALVRCATGSNQVLLQPAPSAEVADQLAADKLELHTETMEETLGGEQFRIRPSSFFQTNSAQAEKMVQMVVDGLLSDTTGYGGDPHNLTIIDAYCGVGTFALILARSIGRVIAIEESPSAIKDAQWNIRDTQNVEVLKGKVEDVLPELSTRADGFVIDPPRAGCQPVVLDALIRHPVARIVYVSCDPSTLARDLHILCHQHPTYRLRSVQPLDMFPQTAHIECVAVLERIIS